MSAAAGGTQQSTIDLDPLEIAAARDDSYVNPLSLFVEATQALNWQRERLRETVLKQGAYLMTGTTHHAYYNEAANKIYSQLSWLTYCRTFYTARALMSCETWNRGVGFKLNVKSKMPYQAKKYLLTISTERRGQPVEWMMDLQGTDLFPEELVDESSVNLLLKNIQERVKIYALQKRLRSLRTSDGDYMVFNMQKPHIVMTDYIVDKSEEAEKLIDVLISDGAAGIIENTIHKQKRLGLGFVPLKGEIHPPENDADVTYNPDRRFKYNKNVQTVPFGEISVQVTKNFSARRQWGTFVEMENKNTIDFINNMMPLIGSGWFEIILQREDKTRLQFKLTPWGEPKTTFVQPFRISSMNSPMISPTATVEQIAAVPFDFRTEGAQDMFVKRLEPYLISGKGNEIDGMVHSILAFDEKTRRKAHDVCAHIIDTELEKEDPTTKIEIMKFMRAYYSTDSNGPSGSLCPFGERSIFFFNVQGEIAGVEMSSPSIQVVNQLVSGNEPRVKRRTRDSSSESRGDDQEERGSGRRGRFERDGWSASRTRSSHAMPPPPGYAAHVPESIMEEMRQTRNMVQELLKSMQAGQAPQQAQNDEILDMFRKVQDKVVDLQEKLEHGVPGAKKEVDDKIATYSDARDEIIILDDIKGWETCVTNEAPEKCPTKIKVSGIPEYPQRLHNEEDELELVKESSPYEFTLDQGYATRDGMPIYVYKDKGGTVMWMYPDSYETYGEFKNPYVWVIWYVTADERGADGKSTTCMITKTLDGNTLVKNGRKEVKWEFSFDLKKNLNMKTYKVYKFDVRIQIDEGGDFVNRAPKWQTTVKTSRSIVRRVPNTNNFAVDNNHIENTIDPRKLVDGLAGDKYIAQMFTSFGIMPANDRSGMLPSWIEFKISDSWVQVPFGNHDIMRKDINIKTKFDLVDTKEPIYQAQYMKGDTTYRLQIRPFYNHEKEGYTWGLKSDGGEEQDLIWVGALNYKKKKRDAQGTWVFAGYYPPELITFDQQDRWHMERCWDNLMKIERIESMEIDIDYNRQGTNKRTPSIPNLTRSKTQEEEIYGVFSPLKSEALARMFESTSKQKIEAVSKFCDTALTMGNVCKFGLFMFHKKFCEIMNQRIGLCRRFQDDSVPKHITMNHTFLQGEGAIRKGNAFPEDSYNLFLVDLQGPVWVSVDGEFMISPYANESAKYKTWALWRWNVHKAAYMLFAEKIGKANQGHLINDKDFDNRNKIDSTWNFRGRWDGAAMTAKNSYDDMRIYIHHDLKQDVRVPQNVKGKFIPNLYHLFQRMPDYTIGADDVELFRSMNSMNVRSLEERIKRREEQAKQQSEEQQEKRDDLDCAFVDEEIGQGIDEEFKAGTVLGMKAWRGKSASEAGKDVVVAHHTKKGEQDRQKADAIRAKELAEAKRKAEIDKQGALDPNSFMSIQDAIVKLKDTDKRMIQREKKRKNESDEIESLPAEGEEQIEKKRINVLKNKIRDKVKSFVNPELTKHAKDTYISNTEFISKYDKDTIDEKTLDNMADSLTQVAERIANEETKTEFEKASKEDQKEMKKVVKQLIEKCVVDTIIKILVVINAHAQKIMAIAEAKRQRQEEQLRRAEERQEKKRREEAKKAAASGNSGGTVHSYDAMRIWEDDMNGGVRPSDDLFREDDAPQAARAGDYKDMSSSDDDEEEEDFTKSDQITLVEPLITEVTPWTEIMQIYRNYLTREKDIKNEKAQRYKEKMEKLNTQQAVLKQQREEQERREAEERTRDRLKLLEEKKQLEDHAVKEHGTPTVIENSEMANALNQCRVFQGSSASMLPVQFKVKIVKDNKGDVLPCTFILDNPLMMRYKCEKYHLKLEPQELNTGKTEGTTEYAWKLSVYNQDMTDSVAVATKWKTPGVLMPEHQEKDAWRWRLASLSTFTNMIVKRTTTAREIREFLTEKLTQKNMVWYRGINFDPAMKDLEQGLLPLYQLRCKSFKDERTRLYHYDDAQVANVIQNMAITVWNIPVLRENLMKMFEVPTAIFMSLKIQKYQKWLTFVIKDTENEISWTCNDLNSMILILQPANGERSEDNSWIICGKTKQQESDIKEITVEFLRKKTNSLLDTDHNWIPIPASAGLQNEKLEQFHEYSMKVLNNSGAATVNVITEHINPDNACMVQLPNMRRVPCVSELKYMEFMKDFLKPSFQAADDLHYIRSEANEFDPTAHANFTRLMSKIIAGITAAGADPTAEISEECEGGLASPRTGARRALASRANLPAAVQLLPLQSRKQAQQERKRLSVTAPPPRSLPVLSKRLHGH